VSLLGLHWFLQGRGGEARLRDIERIRAVLTEIPEALGLTVLTPPEVHSNDPVGTVGMVLLAESHFTVRCVPEEGILRADLFSCLPVDFDPAGERLVSAFDLTDVTHSTLERTIDEG
jgi:S-adenosylmethionine/arginine decarboxylase-like enzyme